MGGIDVMIMLLCGDSEATAISSVACIRDDYEGIPPTYTMLVSRVAKSGPIVPHQDHVFCDGQPDQPSGE